MSAVVDAREPSAKYLAQVGPPLLRRFEQLSGAESGVASLREIVLSLAVRGELTCQDSKEEPAVQFLARISVEKARLTDAARVRRVRRDGGIGATEELQCDFEIPRGWAIARLSDLALPQAGFAFKSSAFNDIGDGVPLIRIRDVGASDPRTYFSGEYREEFVVNAGDWLIGMDGDFRVASWTGPRSLLNQRVTRLIFFGDETRQSFVAIALQRELRKLQGTKAYTTVDHLSGAQIAACVIAVPPVAEQHRIVARVEELIKLCDALEQSGRLADEQHARLTSTLFDALAASESAHALAENWQRIAEHFDLLLDRPEAIDALERTVLDLAVRGLLAPHSSAEGAVQAALRNAYQVKREMVDRGELPRRSMPEAPWLEDQPFDVPEHWSFVGLDHLASPVANALKAGPFGSALKKDSYVAKGFKIYGQEQVIAQDPSIGDYYISPSKFQELKSCAVRSGDLLVSLVGTIGKVLLLPNTIEPGIINPRLIKLTLDFGLMIPEYMQVLLAAPRVRDFLFNQSHGTTMDVLNLTILRSLPIALPPVAEQHRIVARVEELRRLCAQLRERLTEARRTQSQLAEALVAQAVA